MCGSELGQAAVWMESWQKVPLADYQNRDNFLNGFTGDAGRWLVDDHIDECDGVNPHPPIARIAADGANIVTPLVRAEEAL